MWDQCGTNVGPKRRVRWRPLARKDVGGPCDAARMERKLAQAGDTAVPAILTLETAGFELQRVDDLFVARRSSEEFVVNDPVGLLGLVALVEARGWEWGASDEQIDSVLSRFGSS